MLTALLILPVSAARAAITLENASTSSVVCRITPGDQAASRDVRIAPGKSESLDAARAVSCEFRSAGQANRYNLQPGRQYRFMLSSAGQLELRAIPATTAQPPAPLARKWPHVREVKVIVAGGKEYRAFHREKWQGRARGIVEAAAARFEQQFPIHFRVVGFRDWEYKTAPQTASDAFQWLHKIELGDADLVIGFTMVPFPGPRGEIRGVSQYYSQRVVLPDCWGTSGATTRLVHELCHVLGAFHVVAEDSVMQMGFERTPLKFTFGKPTEETIELGKDVDLKIGVDSLSPDTQKRIRAIYRTFHHPLENLEDDPIVVGYRYQARRAGWLGDDELSRRMQQTADQLAPAKPETPAPEHGLQ
ncbi:MAG TPA: hypothetical protein VGN12_22080 [Pirellulales bacterium]